MLGADHYDCTSDNYMPELRTNDMSTATSGTNPYDCSQYPDAHKKRLVFEGLVDSDDWIKNNLAVFIILVVLGVLLVIAGIVVSVYCYRKRQAALKYQYNAFKVENKNGNIQF